MRSGNYKLLGQHRARRAEPAVAVLGGAMRTQRIVDSLRFEIAQNPQVESVRIRQVFWSPREIFRVELEVPEMNYQRTTLLDRDALEELLEADEVRALVREPVFEDEVAP